jgi:hypothetical protein
MEAVPVRNRRAGNCVRGLACVAVVVFGHLAFLTAQNGKESLRVKIDPADGSYTIRVPGLVVPVLKAGVAVQLDGRWLQSGDYPKHTVKTSRVSDFLGPADKWKVTFSGLSGEPDLTYCLRSYVDKPFADLQVFVQNSTPAPILVKSIRPIAALGDSILDLGGPVAEDRVLSDSFSENMPDIRILEPSKANPIFRGVGSQLVYNRQSHRSVFVGALTSDRFLTVLRVHLAGNDKQLHISAYEVDSTGTTDDPVQLKLSVSPGAELPSERVLLSINEDYHRQLETYGSLIRQLHHARVTADPPMGWWSWTAYYFGLNEGAALTNAQWLSQNLKQLGYDFFHIDEGYQYARGEYSTPNATLFPHGLAGLERKITHLGLVPGIWTAPFQVSERSWVYENHRDWLVHNAKGEPIGIGTVTNEGERLFVLDCTNPGAQNYLRRTYSTLVNNWGIRYIKLDFMDGTAIEGYYYRPNTTALEAQRIGLGIIRDTVGNDVLLDKDGSVMLNPVGYVDFGRISEDTAHLYSVTKIAASGIAARYYMNRNFFVNDPDAFNVSTQTLVDDHGRHSQHPLTLDEAEVSIALAAVSGGMFEIGDDLPILESEPERLALIQNQDLIDMVRLGQASTPVDLMTFLPKDEQPSIFFLKESPRQSILTVFNWTDGPQTRTIRLSSLGINEKAPYMISNVLHKDESVIQTSSSLLLNQPARSVRVLKIIDTSFAARPPRIRTQHPQEGKAGETVKFLAYLASPETPVLSYRWNFGDGVTLMGTQVSHAYTQAGSYLVKLTANGLDGLSGQDTFRFIVSGSISTGFVPAENRRYESKPMEPSQ